MKHKKQAFEINQQTIQWNTARGNTANTLDWQLEIDMLQEELDELKTATTDVDRLDALCDLKFVLTGSQGKLELSAEQITESDQVVLTANEMKGTQKNAAGKIVKPDNWADNYAPERHLQLILDKRPK